LATHRERYGLLLGAIIVAFSIQGIAEPGKFEEILVSVLLGVTLLLALWVADTKPRIMWPAVAIVLALILTSVVEAANGSVGGGATRVANALLVGLAPPAIVIGVVRSLRTRQAVTLEAVFGVLCVYILLGMFFAAVYGTIDRLGGAPFFAGGQEATVARCIYFSFTNLTTLGYGDFTARTNLGHTLSVSEALLGQIYLVTVVSLIVANLGRSRPAPKAQ
jgi:Ion channel